MPAAQNWPTIISALLDGEDLSVSDAAWCMEQVMTGTVDATPSSPGSWSRCA